MPICGGLGNINNKLFFLALMAFRDQTALLNCKGPLVLLSSVFYPHPESHGSEYDSSLSYYFFMHTNMFHSVKGQGRVGVLT